MPLVPSPLLLRVPDGSNRDGSENKESKPVPSVQREDEALVLGGCSLHSGEDDNPGDTHEQKRDG